MKRAMAFVMGVLSLAAGSICAFVAVEAFQDFANPGDSLWLDASGTLIACGMSLAAFVIGFRLLIFAFRGRENQVKDSVAKAILLGIGCFIPGFAFSLPISFLLAIHVFWPGKAQGDLGALPISVCIGAVSAIVGCTVLVKKRNVRRAQI